jgi:hypothetical protein
MLCIRGQFEADCPRFARRVLRHCIVQTVAAADTMHHIAKGWARIIGRKGIAAGLFGDALHASLHQHRLWS